MYSREVELLQIIFIEKKKKRIYANNCHSRGGCFGLALIFFFMCTTFIFIGALYIFFLNKTLLFIKIKNRHRWALTWNLRIDDTKRGVFALG
jgi:hypothetical protein